MNRIVSSIPGRIRVRDKCLCDPNKLNQLTNMLGKVTAITQLQENSQSGSIVIYFDAKLIDVVELERQVDVAVDEINTVSFVETKEIKSTKKQVNRYAKITMLGSLVSSLALATAGQKRWHALTGGLFVVGLGVHLTTYHKSLLR